MSLPPDLHYKKCKMKLFNVKGKESQKEKEMDTQILRNG